MVFGGGRAPIWGRLCSVFADKLLDAALQLALFLLALAQPLLEIGNRKLKGGFSAERNADKIVPTPVDFER